MYVKSLRIAGFKSFADPTILEFEGGVNVIVGPNGSGKSNIADALSWVLGSQAPSSLRGASMEDVIFAGSSGRPRLGFAEVQLTLDNSDRVLPLDLNEVKISRSADRAGASEYKINGAPCRLLDITELLSDTGIGRSIHTVVGQGQLDAVLQARPEERRSFIEEAAQIGKFRRRKDRALRKIERVDDNLTRLNDVLTELRRTIRPLKRQATAAEAFTELMAEQRSLKQRLTGQEIRSLRSDNDEAEAEEGHRVELLNDELSSVRARLEAAQEERERLVQAAEATRSTAHRIARAADHLGSLGRFAAERAATIEARLAAETEEGYRERIRLLENERSRWSAELTSLRETATTLRERAEGVRAEAERARSEHDAAERSLSAARSAETQAAQALVRAEGGAAASRATIGSIESRVKAAVERREVRERELADESASVTKAEAEVESLEKELDRVTEAAAAAETRMDRAREETRSLRERLGASHAERAAADAALETVETVIEMLRDLPGATERLQQLLSEAADTARLSGAGEEEAKAILQRSEAVVETCWQEVARLDEELRRLDALMSGAAERLGGARRRREAREVELATLDEELARTREALAAAERSAAEERASLPAHDARLKELTAAREVAEQSVSETRASATAETARVREAELEARGAEERALAAQLRLEEAEGGISDASTALEGLADLRSSLEGDRDRALSVAEAANEAATQAGVWSAEAEERAQSAVEKARAGEHHLGELRNRERELSETLERVIQKRNEAEVRRAEARARIGSLAERAMEDWGLTVGALVAMDPFDEEDLTEARERVDKLERQMRRMGVINPRAAEEFAELAERERFLVEQMDDLKSSRSDLLKVVDEVDSTIVEVFGQAFEDVAAEFSGVFDRLFPGGSGALKLTDPDDLLNSGIEVEARPPGKNVRKLSLLSGGERSLVALAFLFSIFRSRPSPFYLLDEVEAALDDLNLQRFISLVDELEERAQILIVTHQKRTMEAADVLYGVSMGTDGVSKVVAKRMEEVVRV